MFYKAKQLFDDAKKYINSQSDPVTWDLINGLSELTASLQSLEEKVDRIEYQLRQKQ